MSKHGFNVGSSLSDDSFLSAYFVLQTKIWGAWERRLCPQATRDAALKEMRTRLEAIRVARLDTKLREITDRTTSPAKSDLLDAYADALARNAKVNKVRANKAYGV